MQGFETINISVDARGVATLLLDRPEKHNALSALMIDELTQAAKVLADDQDIRVVILKAAGKSFCAGGDLKWMQDQMKADDATRAREAKALAMMLFALNSMPKPLIGCLMGNAFGGGVGMASVCDVALGVPSVKMGLTEVRLGLIPATISPYVIARMGAAKARRVFMSARIFGAEEARDLGLLARVVAPEDMDAALEAEVLPYLAAAPEAVARSKRLALQLGGEITEAMIDHTIQELVDCWNSETAQEGVAAFFEKRPARWVDQNT